MICNLIVASLCLPTYADKAQMLLQGMTQRYIYENKYGTVDIMLGTDVVIVKPSYAAKPKLHWKDCKSAVNELSCSTTFAGNAQGNATITIKGKSREDVWSQWKLIQFAGGTKIESLEPVD